jgi:hypothetical protein
MESESEEERSRSVSAENHKTAQKAHKERKEQLVKQLENKVKEYPALMAEHLKKQEALSQVKAQINVMHQDRVNWLNERRAIYDRIRQKQVVCWNILNQIDRLKSRHLQLVDMDRSSVDLKRPW